MSSFEAFVKSLFPLLYVLFPLNAMKFRDNILFLVLFFSITSSYAQNLPQSHSSAQSPVEYQWPRNGDEDVPQKTTFIVRPTKVSMNGRSEADFSFYVKGEVSGTHTGRVIISSDNQTIIFKPDQPFTLNERVTVRLEVAHVENVAPISYSFRTTSMSEVERGRALFALHEREDAENEAALQASANTQATILPMGTDTIAFVPTTVVIDTLTDTTKEGNIFFSPTAKFPSPFSFLAIVTDTATKSQPDTNNFLFERDIPVGCGNFRMQSDGTLTYFQQFSSPTGGVFDGQIVHLDQKMRVIDTFQCVGYNADLHDFQLLFNKRAILVAYSPRKVAMKQYLDTIENGAFASLSPKAKDTAIVFDAIIQELDENKNLVFQWNSKDHFQLVDATRDINLVPINPNHTDTLIDYMHINAAIRDPNDGNFIASFRHCDEVSKIDSTGKFIWRWGGRHNQFTFLGDTLKFSHQHDPERIPGGNITLFDNGNLHTKVINGIDSTVPSTRAIEYTLDEVKHTATTVWQFNNLPYCQAAGNVQRFDKTGNTLIGLGIVAHPSAVEIDKNGKILFQLSMPPSAFSYRTYRFPFTPKSSVRQTGTASAFGIANIYPNPAQNNATVSFSVSSAGLMQITLLDILGHTLRSTSEKLPVAGTYSTDLDLHDLPAGTYYCKLSQNGEIMTKMVVVQK
jgi:hypothetical protein